jgi:hypothetical protein
MRLLLLLAACVPEPARPPDVPEGAVVAVATASDDYTAGALVLVGVADRRPVDVATLHGDSVVVAEDGALFVVERFLVDAVRRYDGAVAAPVWQVSTGRGSNPHDVARCGADLVVSRHEATSLLRLDPATGSVRGTVALGDLADADGLPEASDLVVHDGVLHVGLQRLDRDAGWSSSPGGRRVRIDCASGARLAVDEVGPNPVLVPGPEGVAVVSEDGVDAGAWSLDDVDDARPVDAALDAAGGVVVARDGASRHVVACVDGSGQVAGVLHTPRYVSDAVLVGDEAWLAARRGWTSPETPGAIVVVDRGTCTVTEEISTLLAPFSLVLLPEALASSPDVR